MSLQSNDLRDLVSKKIHIDEYRSKMGDDADVIVFSFKVDYYDPATELTNFIEKGYEWVLDADTSSGEMEDGSYVVFIETLRRPSFPQHLMRLVDDMKNLTGQDAEEYLFKYHKTEGYQQLSEETLAQIVPLTPDKYRAINGETDSEHDHGDEEEETPIKVDTAEESKQLKRALESIQTAAGIPIKAKPILDRELAEFVNLSRVSRVNRG